MDYYANATSYSKARLDLISTAIAYGNANNYPMQYLASIKLYPEGNFFVEYFGGDTPASAANAMANEYNKYKGTWADKMYAAGVSND